jgi:hypothetical protein
VLSLLQLLVVSSNIVNAVLIFVDNAATDITDHDVQWSDSDSDDDTVQGSSSSTPSDSESNTEALHTHDTTAAGELLDDSVDMSHLLRTAVVVKADTGNALAAVLDSLDGRPDVQVSCPYACY